MICRWCRQVIVRGRPLFDVPEMWIVPDWPFWHMMCQDEHGLHEPLNREIAVREIAMLLS